MKQILIKDPETVGSDPDVGLALRKIRQEHKYSQYCVACNLGISRNTYILYERNKVKLTVIQCVRICEFYNIALSSFISAYLEKPLPALLKSA